MSPSLVRCSFSLDATALHTDPRTTRARKGSAGGGQSTTSLLRVIHDILTRRSQNSTLVINLVALNGEVDDLREESLDFYRSEESSTADEAGSLMYPDEDAETSVHGSFDEEFIETDDEILINVGPEITFPDSDDDSRCSICGGSCCSEDTDVEM